MREVTITFTAEFTEVVKDPADLEFIGRTPPEELAKLRERSMRQHTNYDDIRVRDFKVFPDEGKEG